MDHIVYNWKDASVLRRLLEELKKEDGILGLSSEGALFEYAEDKDVLENLKALDEAGPRRTVVVGSITGNNELTQVGNDRFPLKRRGLDGFQTLTADSGWKILHSHNRPASHNVLMVRI